MDVISVLRQFKVGPFAIFDTALAYVGIFLIAPLLTKLFAKIHIHISRVGWLWLTLPISVLFHFVFHQNTPFMKMLLNPNSFYLPTVVLLVMLYMGLRDVKTPKTD